MGKKKTEDQNEHTAELRVMLCRYATLQQTKAEIQEYIKDAARGLAERRALAKLVIDKKEREIAIIDAEERETYAAEYGDLADVTESLGQVEKEMRAAVAALPAESVRKGLRVQVEGVPLYIQVSKATLRPLFDSEKVLAAVPTLRTVRVDNDPVVEEVVNPDLLDRLLAENFFPEATAKKLLALRREVKTRNPSMRLRSSDETLPAEDGEEA